MSRIKHRKDTLEITPRNGRVADSEAPASTDLGSFRTGAVEMPVAFGLDGLIAFIETDELDVREVVVRRLAGPMN